MASPIADAERPPADAQPSSGAGWEVEAFYDGGCPLCRREIDWLRRLDRRDRVRFTDIAAEGFDPGQVGKTHDELMAEMHARLPGGRMVKGVEAFRQLYAAVGFGPLVAPTRLPGVRHALDAGYKLFARNRLRLTGRSSADGCDVCSP